MFFTNKCVSAFQHGEGLVKGKHYYEIHSSWPSCMFRLLDNHAQNQAVSFSTHCVLHNSKKDDHVWAVSPAKCIYWLMKYFHPHAPIEWLRNLKLFIFFHQHRLSTAAVIVENLQVVSDCKHVKIGIYWGIFGVKHVHWKLGNIVGIFGGHSETTRAIWQSVPRPSIIL